VHSDCILRGRAGAGPTAPLLVCRQPRRRSAPGAAGLLLQRSLPWSQRARQLQEPGASCDTAHTIHMIDGSGAPRLHCWKIQARRGLLATSAACVRAASPRARTSPAAATRAACALCWLVSHSLCVSVALASHTLLVARLAACAFSRLAWRWRAPTRGWAAQLVVGCNRACESRRSRLCGCLAHAPFGHRHAHRRSGRQAARCIAIRAQLLRAWVLYLGAV
jgi:hypothetical protein